MSTTPVGIEGGSATSPDGRLQLVFPASTLAEDTDITIEQVTPERLQDQFPDTLIRHAYRLGPEGLSFDPPVEVVLQVDGNPVQDSETLVFDATFLGTLLDDRPELLAPLEIVANTENTGIQVRAPLTHFSPLVGFFFATGEVQYRVEGVPDRLLRGDQRSATISMISFLPVDGESPPQFVDSTDDPAFALAGPEQPWDAIPLTDTGENNTFTVSVDYRCETPGIGPFSGELRAIADIAGTEFSVFQTNFRAGIDADFGKLVLCEENPGSTAGLTLNPGLFNVPGGLTRPEDVWMVLSFTQDGRSVVGNLVGDLLAVFSGQQGSVVADIANGGAVQERFLNELVPGRFGSVVVSQPNPGPETPAAIIEFGPDGAGFLRNYNVDTEAFNQGGNILRGDIFDACSIGGDTVSNTLVFAGTNGVGSFSYRPEFGTYERDELFVSDFGGAAPVAACGITETGPRLVLTGGSDSRLHLMAADGTVTEIGAVGNGARKFDCDQGVCALTLFNEDAIQPFLWDGVGTPTLVGEPIPVGDGPVNLDLLAVGDTVHVVVPGFNDNSLSRVVLDASGATLSTTTIPVREGCQQPGHARWVANPDPTLTDYLVGTCFGSDRYYIEEAAVFDAAP